MDNMVVRMLTKISDLIILNILWIVFSLPIVTIGASTTALYCVTIKMVKNEEGYIVQSFLCSFKKNVIQSTIVWLGVVVVGIFLFVDMKYVMTMNSTVKIPLLFCIYLVSVVLLFIVLYVFPLIARFENRTTEMLKNALLLSLVKLPMTMLLCGVSLAPIILTLLTGKSLAAGAVIWSIIGVALVAYANSYILAKAFEKLEL